jgi:osmotically-inducible protein OsmY
MVFKPQTFHEMPPQAELDNPTSALVEANVAEALSRAGHLDASRVTVVVHSGAVTLEGFVSSRSEVDTAGEVAGRVAGVRRVDNRLLIQTALAS